MGSEEVHAVKVKIWDWKKGDRYVWVWAISMEQVEFSIVSDCGTSFGCGDGADEPRQGNRDCASTSERHQISIGPEPS